MVSWSISYLPKLLVGQRISDHSSNVRIQEFLAAVGVSMLRIILCRISRVIAAKANPQLATTGHLTVLCKAISSFGSVLGRDATYEEGFLGIVLSIWHIYSVLKWQLVSRASSKAHLGS